MDYQRHPSEPRQEVSYNHQLHEPNKKKPRRMLKLLTALLLIVAAAYGTYYWRDKEANTITKRQQSEIAALEQRVSDLRRAVADAKNEVAQDEAAEPKAPALATLDNIEAAVKSGNYAALQGYMATKVNVIIAASGGVGERTAAQAVTDIKYLDTGTDPWDFSLPEATLSDYRAGDYKQYFPATAFVGKSANNYLVSFNFDGDSKINGIFMAANANQL
ncbi:hypothetical protein H0X09_03145 [Candidatus Saccharibacteria bacterium]|nr:hypothetical protein [Candidatus Saccharibacteria bacterium]